MENKAKVKIIILAAGKGTRMESDLPKVLVSLNGKPMIQHLLESIRLSGLDPHPVVVVGYKKELVIKELGNKYIYVDQKEMLGTGHAVHMTEEILRDKTDNVIVLYGDIPFIDHQTIQNIFAEHFSSKSKMTMGTVKLKDFKDWRACFEHYSRVIRDESGKIIRTVEKKDATEEELKITEINPCFFCFDAKWLWEEIKNIKNENSQKEFYLPDLIALAVKENSLESIEIEPHEALGANTKEELQTLE
ncbi:MAG: NTP transferase domain-containing protein, partial [Patescibacteria group bacterium]